MKKIILIFGLLFVVSSNKVFSQFGMDYSIVGGITTTNILGNNPATHRFETEHDDGTYTFGASFQEVQSGIDLHLVIPLDDLDFYRLPIGFDYTFYRSKELTHIQKLYNNEYQSVDNFLEYDLDVFSIYSGLHYVLIKYPKYDINVFVGSELRGYLIYNDKLTGTVKLKDKDLVVVKSYKEPALRLGGKLLIGGEGKIKNNWYANFSFGLSMFNLIGQDASRGELLTPSDEYETNESFLYAFHFNLGFKYKFSK